MKKCASILFYEQGGHMSTELFDLTGKVAVITGGSARGGLGHALALGFARAGADMAVCDIDKAGAEETAQEVQALGRRGLGGYCDVSKPDLVEAFFAEVDRAMGHVDILVNNAFSFPAREHPHELSLAAWEKTLVVSITGYFLCAQQAIRRMLAQGTGGAILNISSIAGASALGRGNFPYSVAKGGVNQLTKELAVEYACQGIRVNAILPAQIETPGFNLLDDKRFSPALRRRLLEGIPLNRLLQAEEFVGPAVFLCSGAGSAVTGVLLPVDGGNLALNAGGSHTWPTDGI
jgi:NAD(P)-dependent dehydrogenase (short-subunit alcohol dehydrogenase family)